MKKVISSIIIATALLSSVSVYAGEKISKEQRQQMYKECRKEAKKNGQDMSDKEGLKAVVGKCVKAKVKEFKKQKASSN